MFYGGHSAGQFNHASEYRDTEFHSSGIWRFLANEMAVEKMAIKYGSVTVISHSGADGSALRYSATERQSPPAS